MGVGVDCKCEPVKILNDELASFLRRAEVVSAQQGEMTGETNVGRILWFMDTLTPHPAN
jgi:hypothetical protein